jgi:hypothetical protein
MIFSKLLTDVSRHRFRSLASTSFVAHKQHRRNNRTPFSHENHIFCENVIFLSVRGERKISGAIYLRQSIQRMTRCFAGSEQGSRIRWTCNSRTMLMLSNIQILTLAPKHHPPSSIRHALVILSLPNSIPSVAIPRMELCTGSFLT